eukprot:SAG11_NODE_31422_length_292_cov_0.580311_1_plen_66_part_10
MYQSGIQTPTGAPVQIALHKRMSGHSGMPTAFEHGVLAARPENNITIVSIQTTMDARKENWDGEPV